MGEAELEAAVAAVAWIAELTGDESAGEVGAEHDDGPLPHERVVGSEIRAPHARCRFVEQTDPERRHQRAGRGIALVTRAGGGGEEGCVLEHGERSGGVGCSSA